MPGVIVNTVLVIVGSLLGLACKKGLPQKLSDAVMTALGVCVVFIGISGSLKGEQALVTVVALVLGTLLGTLLDIDGHLNRLGEWVNKKFNRGGQSSLAEGFVSGSLLFCIGAMAVVGSLEAGLTGNNQTLYIKSLLDLVSSTMMAATMGLGVMLAGVTVFVYQGAFVLLAGLLQPILSNWAVNEMTCVGSLMIICIGLNMMKITKIKVADMLPGVIIAPLICVIYTALV